MAGIRQAAAPSMHWWAGKRSPFLDDLREAFDSEGHDRLGALRNSRKVDPLFRPLAAAVVSARLQARKAVLDLQDRTPAQPTYWVVLPCVTVNRHELDTEIVCGVYTVDGRDGERAVTYSGTWRRCYRVSNRTGQRPLQRDRRPGMDHTDRT